MLEKLRKQNELLIEKYSNNEQMLKKQLLINTLLKDDACFFKIKIDDAFNIIRDLEFKSEDIDSIYQQLISFKEYKNIAENFIE